MAAQQESSTLPKLALPFKSHTAQKKNGSLIQQSAVALTSFAAEQQALFESYIAARYDAATLAAATAFDEALRALHTQHDRRVETVHGQEREHFADMEANFYRYEACINHFLTGLHVLGERFNQLTQDYTRLVKEDVLAREKENEHFATTVKQVQEEAYGKAKATILKAVEEGERMKKRRQSDLLAAMAAAEE